MQANSDGLRDIDTIDIRTFVAMLFEWRWWIIGSVAVCATGFTLAAFMLTPIYRATVVMVPAAQERGQGSLSSALDQLGGLASLAGLNMGGANMETEEALAVLRSREFGERFIHDHGLIRKLFPKDWDEAHQKWKDEAKHPTPARAFRYFDRTIRSVNHDKKTGLVTLQIEWRDRVEAAEWANELVGRLNTEMQSRAIARASANLDFLGKELETTSTIETREAISRLMEMQIKQRMLANVSQEYALRVIDKALPADADDPVRPKKLVLIAVGLLLGVALGVGGAVLMGRPTAR